MSSTNNIEEIFLKLKTNQAVFHGGITDTMLAIRYYNRGTSWHEEINHLWRDK